MSRRSVALALAVAASVLPLSAQPPGPGGQAPGPGPGGQPPPTAGLVKRGKAPVSNEVLKVKLPKPKEADLANGVRLIVLEDRRLPRVSFRSSSRGPAGITTPMGRPVWLPTRRR